MHRLLPVCLFSALFLVACGGATVSRSGPIAPDDPAPRIDHLIVQSGDIPSGYSAVADRMPWRIYPGIPTTETASYYEIIVGNDRSGEVGHIAVLYYRDKTTANNAYGAMRSEAEAGKKIEVIDFGDYGSVSGPIPEYRNSDLVFQLCTTAIHASFPGHTVSDLKTYGRNLEKRLRPAVCK